MRVDTQIQERMTLAGAMAVLDLVRSGVLDELAEAPYPWFEEPAVVRAPVAAAPAAAPAPAVAADVRPARAAAPLLMSAKVERQVVQAPVAAPDLTAEAKVWTAGEAGGVVLVLRAGLDADGQVPVSGKALTLLTRMLEAVEIRGAPLGWAVVGCPVDVVQPALQEPLQQAVAGLAPTRVLVLGQVAVGTLAGQSLGVEGWQAAPRPLVPGWEGPLGVTYPPELLLARPLFKRLAWQHLQKWRIEAGWNS